MEEQVAPEVQVPQKPKRKWLKIGLLIAGGLALLGLTAYAGFWYSKKRATPPPPKEEEPSTFAPLTQPQPTPPTEKESESTDWKVYANDVFSIKHPRTWTVEGPTQEDKHNVLLLRR